MSKFEIKTCSIEGLLEINPKVFSDNRGFFLESYNEREFKELGLDLKFVQDNHSKSKKGVLRGLHFQTKHPQGKLVRVLKGQVFDVAVDLRPNSRTYGKWHSVLLTEEEKNMFYVPEGFAHGFLVLSDEAEFFYKCTDYYYPKYESGIIWNDKDIDILWPANDMDIILSQKDMNLKTFKELKII